MTPHTRQAVASRIAWGVMWTVSVAFAVSLLLISLRQPTSVTVAMSLLLAALVVSPVAHALHSRAGR